MQNKVDFLLPPEDLFLNPGEDPGIRSVVAPEFFWRPRPAARILGISASEHPEINRKIDSFLQWTARHKTFAKAVEFNTLPVELDHARFKKSFLTASGRAVLSGASGTRLQNRYLWANEDRGFDPDHRLADYFRRCQDRNGDRPFPMGGRPHPETPFALECRNTFNFYHFVTETLCQLCTLDDIGSDRPIFVHFPNQEQKTRPFASAFISALFPELGDRVSFERAPKSYDRVLTAYNLTNSYFQWSEQGLAGVDDLIASRQVWKGRWASRAAQGVLSMNAVDRNLIRLRERGLRAIEGMDFSHLPKRFYLGRAEGLARSRTLKGEEELVEMLALFGFQEVTFETMSPFEQVALMAQAEVMISTHGAGFTNMIFANPQAYIVELGTLQTAQFRWGDFWRLANVSGANFISFFADFASENPLSKPQFSEVGIQPVHLSRHGLAVVMSFLVALLGHIPTLSRKSDILRLARQMLQLGVPDRALALFRQHPGAEDGHRDLCLALAEVHRSLEDPKAELAALEKALLADPARAYTAMQMVWCAQKLGDRTALTRALRALQNDFPARFDDLVRERPWMRRLV